MVENEVIITEGKDVAECLNSYFARIVETLSIFSEVTEDYERSDPKVDAIYEYASHQSIKKIRGVYGTLEKFEFSKVDSTQVFSEVY